MKVRVRHAERLEHVRLGKSGEWLSADALHDRGEQRVCAVVVFELRPRREVEATGPGEDIHDLLLDAVRRVRRQSLERECLPQAARVRQQVPNRHRVFTPAPFRDEVPDLIVERQLPLPGGQQHAHRRELFRDRRGVEHGRRRDRDSEVEVRGAIAALVGDDTVPADAERASRGIRPVPSREELVDSARRRLRSRSRGTGDQCECGGRADCHTCPPDSHPRLLPPGSIISGSRRCGKLPFARIPVRAP
jgi:hypothetical protein